MEYRWEAVWSVFRGDGALKQDIDEFYCLDQRDQGGARGAGTRT